MRGFKLYGVLFVVWALTMSNPCGGESGFPLTKWHMHMVNGLSAGRILFVHCQSKDDDLGGHNLTTGSEFTWTFRNNFWGSTLFWCYTRTGNQHATFNVFWLKPWLETRCHPNTCIWTAKDDGFYLRNMPAKHDEFVHKWENGW